MTGAQALADPVRDALELEGLAEVERGSAGRLFSITSMIRPGRGDITTIRVDRNTASEIEWVHEHHRLAGPAPEQEQLLVQMVAGDLVKRAEGLVHEQEIGLEAERAGDRDALLHAARKLPRGASRSLRD